MGNMRWPRHGGTLRSVCASNGDLGCLQTKTQDLEEEPASKKKNRIGRLMNKKTNVLTLREKLEKQASGFRRGSENEKAISRGLLTILRNVGVLFRVRTFGDFWLRLRLQRCWHFEVRRGYCSWFEYFRGLWVRLCRCRNLQNVKVPLRFEEHGKKVDEKNLRKGKAADRSDQGIPARYVRYPNWGFSLLL